MNYQLFTVKQKEEIKQLFTKTFGDSEGAAVGESIGALTNELIEGTNPEDIKVFVAMDGGNVVASILFTRLTFESDKTVFLLAPVAVHTDYQRKGVGTTLIHHGLQAMQELGVSLAFTYGDPNYYSRVGFEPVAIEQYQAPLQLSMPHGWLAKSLTDDPLSSISGASSCVPAFNNPALW